MTEEKQNNSWIVFNYSKTSKCDETLKEHGCIDYYLDEYCKEFSIGDVVYIYRDVPYKSIQWKCHVTDVNYYLNDNSSDSTHYTEFVSTEFWGPYIELELDMRFVLSDSVSKEKLMDNGLDCDFSVPVRLNQEMITYINQMEVYNLSEKQIENYLNHHIDYSKLYDVAYEHSIQYPFYSNPFGEEHYEDPYVTQSIIRGKLGRCYLCEQPAPFEDDNGIPYLELHHIVPYEKGGKHILGNVVALCPNCHRRVHILHDEKDIEKLKGEV